MLKLRKCITYELILNLMTPKHLRKGQRYVYRCVAAPLLLSTVCKHLGTEKTSCWTFERNVVPFLSHGGCWTAQKSSYFWFHDTLVFSASKSDVLFCRFVNLCPSLLLGIKRTSADLFPINLISCELFLELFLFSTTSFYSLLLPPSQLFETCYCHHSQNELIFF